MDKKKENKIEAGTEEPILKSCCECMSDAYKKRIVVTKSEKSGHNVHHNLHIARITTDSMIVYCPFCGKKIDLDKWEYIF